MRITTVFDEPEPASEPEDRNEMHQKFLAEWMSRQDDLLSQLRRQQGAAKEAVNSQETLAGQLMSEHAEMRQRLKEFRLTPPAAPPLPSFVPHILGNPQVVRQTWDNKSSFGGSSSSTTADRAGRVANFQAHGLPESSPYMAEDDDTSSRSPQSSSGDLRTDGSRRPRLHRAFSDIEKIQRERLRQVRMTKDPAFLAAKTQEALESTQMRWCICRYVRAMVMHNAFDWVAGGILMANCIMIGFQVQYKAIERTNDLPAWITGLDYSFSAWFVTELALRVFAFGPSGFFFAKDWSWNWFDFVIVAITVLETAATFIIDDNESGLENVAVVRLIRVIRIARVLRVIRVMRFFRALRILVTAISGTIKSFVWTVLLLSMINYLFGVAFTQAAVDFDIDMRSKGTPEEYEKSELDMYYGDLFKAILTLFQASTGGIDWKQALDPLQDLQNSWLFVALFLIFIFFVYLAVLNVVTGLFCQTAIEMAQSDHQDLVHQFIAEKQRFVKSLASLFKEWDTSKDGEITLTEFEDHLDDEKMRAFLRALDIDIQDSWTLFKLLDKDKGGSVNLEEFVEGCLRLKGPAKSMQVHQMIYENRFMSGKFLHFMEVCEDSFAELKADAVKLEDRVDGQMLALKDNIRTMQSELATQITSKTEVADQRPRLHQASPYSTLRGVAWGDWSNSIRAKPPLGIEV